MDPPLLGRLVHDPWGEKIPSRSVFLLTLTLQVLVRMLFSCADQVLVGFRRDVTR